MNDGLNGFQRDLVHLLLTHIKTEKKAIQLLGLSLEFYLFSKHTRFNWAISSVFPLIRSHPLCNEAMLPTGRKMLVKNVNGPFNCAFGVVVKKIEGGVWRIDASFLKTSDSSAFGVVRCTPSFPFGDINSINEYCYYESCGGCYQGGCCWGNNPFGKGKVISIQCDMVEKKLYFFLENLRQPVSFKNIPSSVMFFIRCNTRGNAFEFIALRRIKYSPYPPPPPPPPLPPSRTLPWLVSSRLSRISSALSSLSMSSSSSSSSSSPSLLSTSVSAPVPNTSSDSASSNDFVTIQSQVAAIFNPYNDTVHCFMREVEWNYDHGEEICR